jgi:hypothetical protein
MFEERWRISTCTLSVKIAGNSDMPTTCISEKRIAFRKYSDRIGVFMVNQEEIQVWP